MSALLSVRLSVAFMSVCLSFFFLFVCLLENTSVACRKLVMKTLCQGYFSHLEATGKNNPHLQTPPSKLWKQRNRVDIGTLEGTHGTQGCIKGTLELREPNKHSRPFNP